MSTSDYIGFDIHKKTISFCVKAQDGTHSGGRDDSGLAEKAARLGQGAWMGAMEATLFTEWIYDLLKAWAQALQVAHPPMLKAIAAAKKKNDKVDACMIADLLRCNLLPECYMVPVAIRDLRCCATAIWWCDRRRG